MGPSYLVRCVATVVALLFTFHARAQDLAPQPPAPALAPAEEPKKALKTWQEEQRKAAERYNGLYCITLLGDAKAQLVQGEGATTFGGGLRYATLRWDLVLLIRTGTDDNVLDTENAMGSFILSPESFGRPSLEFETRWYPGTTESGDSAYAGTAPRPGFRGYFRASETNWRVDWDGAPLDQSVNAAAVGLGVGGRIIFVANSTNYVEMNAFLGPTIRFLGGDGSANDEENADGKEFLHVAIGDDNRFFGGGDVAVGLRIGALGVGFTVSYFPYEHPSGFGDLQFLGGIQLRDGPSIPLDLPEEEKK